MAERIFSRERRWLAALALGCAQAAAGQEKTIELPELEEIAMAQAPRLKAAYAAVTQLEAQSSAAAGARGPRIDLEAFGRTANPFDATLTDTSDPNNPRSIALPVRKPFAAGANISLTQPLSGLYGLSKTYGAALSAVEAARLRARNVESELKLAVASAFYRHAAAIAQQDRVQAEVAAAKARRDAARSLFQQGLGVETAAVEAELDLAATTAEEVAAQARVDDARAEVESLVGAPLPTTRALSTRLSPPPALALGSEWEARAAEQSPVAQAARADAEAAEQRCDATMQDLFPSLGLVATAGLTYGDLLQPSAGAQASAVLRWNVLDWGVSRANRAAACAQARQASEAARDALLVARNAARQLLRAEGAARDRYAAQQRALEHAAELDRLVREKASRGTATEADALTAHAKLATAKAELSEATASWLLARSRLDTAEQRNK